MAAKSQEVAETIEGTVADRVQQVRSQADSAKEQTVQRIRRVANELDRMSEALRSDDSMAANLAERASRSVDNLANYVSSTDARAILSDTERLARRSPAVFYGGAFLVGLAAGRFFKSSRPDGYTYARRDDYARRDFQDESGYEASGADYGASDYAGDYADYGASERSSGSDWAPTMSEPTGRRSSTSQERFRQNYDAAFGRDSSEGGASGGSTTGTAPGIGSAAADSDLANGRQPPESNGGSRSGKGSAP